MIERKRGIYLGRNKSSAYQNLVWSVATSADTTLDMAGQTHDTLATIERNLLELGSNKQRILSAQVFITDMNKKTEMDEEWKSWLGDDPDHWPQRACVGVALAGDTLVEVTVVAARDGSR